MTDYEESNLKMSLSTVLFLLDHTVITATLPNFSSYFTSVQATNAQLGTLKVQQQADKTGDSTNKKLLKATLMALAIDMIRRLVAFATNEGNNTLLSLVSYNETELKRKPDSQLSNICQIVYDNATSNLASLAEYGITADTLTALKTAITNFDNSRVQSNVDNTNSGQITQQIETLNKTLNTYWAKIDTLVEIVRTSQPDFYSGYKKIRKVVRTHNGSLSLKAQINDQQTGQGMANVTLAIAPAGGTAADSIVKKTADGGGSNFKGLDDGNYTYTAKKPGYKDAAGTVSVVNGENTALTITMEKS
jgi:hypothetical protein